MLRSRSRIFAVAIAFMMLASAFAGAACAAPPADLNPPTSSTDVDTPANVSEITVNGETAYYQTDDNTDGLVYIRAILPDSAGIDELQDAEVVVTLLARGNVSASGINFTPDSSYTIWTATGVDLFNVAYDLAIIAPAEEDYVLAAGLSPRCIPPAAVTVSDVEFAIPGETVSADVYGFVVQNPFLGNQYFREQGTPWTDPHIAYYINAAFEGTIPNRAAVEGSMTIPNGASVTGDAEPQGGDEYEWDLSGTAPGIDVSNGGVSAHYYAFVSDASTVSIDYSFRMDEALGYGGAMNPGMSLAEFKQYAQYIQDKADAYFANVSEVPPKTTVMQVLEAFLENEFDPNDYDTSGGTYLSYLHHLRPFIVEGDADGWMYTDHSDYPDYERWPVPGVGAADYVLTDGANIAWFFTVDYSTHPFE
jgi:hypothetical protein